MNKKLAAEHIDFADSTYKSFEMSENSTLTIHMLSWQENPFKIIFLGVIKFSYKRGDIPKDLYEVSSSLFLEEALLRTYDYIPSKHPYKLYQMDDIDEVSFIEVVAESVGVIKELFADKTK